MTVSLLKKTPAEYVRRNAEPTFTTITPVSLTKDTPAVSLRKRHADPNARNRVATIAYTKS